jgi:hypothetical protein
VMSDEASGIESETSGEEKGNGGAEMANDD